MQEIKKQSIVLASILKPMDDTRMFEKMGKSLVVTNKWDINVIGYGKTFKHDGINFHPLGVFNRISFSRITAPWRVLKLLIRLKPKVIIITTHELLLISVLYSIFHKTRIVYDIQENYYLNVLHTSSFPRLIRLPIALWIRFKEYTSKPFINHYFLAEHCYSNELPFIGNKFTVIENKCIAPEGFIRKSDNNKLQFIFTGTIDSSTGIWETIRLIRQQHQIENKVELIIIGYCALPEIRRRLENEIIGNDFIKTIGINELVPHSKILEAISEANIGIIFYPPAPHNQYRTPTKVYEYLACRLPILYDKNAHWKSIIPKSNSIEIDFKNPDASEILNKIRNLSPPNDPPKEAMWESETPKFLQIINI